jgi:nucleotide-binding universal stress UspA family protein
MYANLIVGFDGSDAGRDGVALARRLALATGARVTAVYARSYLALSDDVRETDEDVPWNEAAERVLDGAREMLADIPGVMCRAVAERVPAHALHSAAEAADAALIVIGSTHRSGIGRIAPGTTADQILHAAPCAVAVAPAGYAEGATNQPLLVVGAAVDGAGESDRVARLAASIARRAGATLRLVTVAEHHSPAGPLYTGGVGYARSEAALRERTT